MSLEEYNINDKQKYLDFADSIYQILKIQKNIILKSNKNNIEILKNNYCYGYVWGFIVKLSDYQK